MGILYYALKGAAIALACWMTAYGGWLSWLHFQSALGPTIAVVAAVGLGIAGHVWRRHIGWSLVLGTIGLAAAAVSASVVIDRTIASRATVIQATKDANLPKQQAERALEDAKSELQAAIVDSKAECATGRKRRCFEAEGREAAARERIDVGRTKVASAGAQADVDPAAVKMATVLDISSELYRTVQSLSPGVLLEIGAPALFAFGLAPLRRTGSDTRANVTVPDAPTAPAARMPSAPGGTVPSAPAPRARKRNGKSANGTTDKRRVRRDNQDETGATIRMRLAPGVG